MKETEYDSEDLLQELIAKYPNLLAGDQVDSNEPRRWILISREFSVPDSESGVGRWSIDHLFIDQDGVPTLVEVKRSTDTRIRREVVGQLLDYAANGLAYWPLESIHEGFELTCSEMGLESDAILAEFLGPDKGIESFWEQVGTNLKLGRIRLVFAADKIPTELQRVVEFLNGQMSPAEVVAIEIKQYLSGTVRALSPRVIGVTAEAQQAKTTYKAGKRWTEERFFEALYENDRLGVDVARKLFEWGQTLDGVLFGHGKESGSFVPFIKREDTVYSPFAVWTFGKLELYFGTFGTKPPFDKGPFLDEIRNRLNLIDGLTISKSPYPKIELQALRNEDVYQKFIGVFDRFVAIVKHLK